jgi:hypothetical protein
MLVSADPSLQHLDAGHAATEGSILVESVPQDSAKARRQAKPKTAAVPTGAVVGSGKEKCDCLNYCGDDDRIRNGKAKPCDEMAEKIYQKEVLVYNGQQLVNAQVEVNRAVFLMNAKGNKSILRHMDPARNLNADIKKHINTAIKHLKSALYE